MFVTSNPIGNDKIRASALDDIKTVVLSGKAKGVTKEDLIELLDSVYKEGEGND
jgi:DNA-binding transcriptional regulator YhcF (GntR family)